ncbi:MAG: GYD domain-containing protein [Planctomycetota bacterium]|nr:GYD domain-containing protein [Planctomycetota bacterium]
MARYVALIRFTAQGVKQIGQSVKRAELFKKEARKLGGAVHEVYWTMGSSDGVLVFDAPDEARATALMLKLSAKGNVHTETMRAFDAKEFAAVMKRA